MQRLKTFAVALLCLPALVSAQGAALTVDSVPVGKGSRTVRPKIGLVLSGGGARGLAHVGVLKILEEARVPIDYVAGTSMGAIVGGLYASGMTPAELERRILALDWDAMFADRPPRDQLSLRRKADDARLSVPLEFGLRDGTLRAPRAAVGSSGLETMLKRLTEGVSGEVDFDRMPIPYRAVATDLVSGEPVVFDHGELAAVMRASMSVPAVFAPVDIGGRLLVDGGLVDNLPVDVVRQMGADIVIAVNIGTPLLPREELGSILGIGMQMLNILTEQNVRVSIASLRPSDVLIVPDLTAVTAIDFKLGREAIARGAEAARGVMPLLEDYGLPGDQYLQHLAVKRRSAVPTRIDEIRIEGTEYATANVLRAQLSVSPGAPFNRAQIERDLAWLQGRGDFERLDYRMVTDRSRNVLLIHVQEKPWGPNYFRFGLNLGTDFRGEGAFNLVGNHTRRWVTADGGEWRNEIQIGCTQRGSTEFYQPLRADETLFASIGAQRERRVADLSVQLPDGSTSRPIATFAGVNTRLWLDLGAAFGRYGELRIGPHYERLSISPLVAPLDANTVRTIDSGFHAGLVIDQRDAAAFARSGYRIEANLQRSLPAFGATAGYTRVQWASEYARSIGDNTFDFALKYGTVFSRESVVFPYFELGGLLQMSGLRPGELRGDRVAFARITGFRRIGTMPAFGRGIYVGGSLETGRIESPSNPLLPAVTLYGGSVFLGLDTSLGPLYVGYGQASGNRRNAYLFLGRP